MFLRCQNQILVPCSSVILTAQMLIHPVTTYQISYFLLEQDLRWVLRDWFAPGTASRKYSGISFELFPPKNVLWHYARMIIPSNNLIFCVPYHKVCITSSFSWHKITCSASWTIATTPPTPPCIYTHPHTCGSFILSSKKTRTKCFIEKVQQSAQGKVRSEQSRYITGHHLA